MIMMIGLVSELLGGKHSMPPSSFPPFLPPFFSIFENGKPNPPPPPPLKNRQKKKKERRKKKTYPTPHHPHHPPPHPHLLLENNLQRRQPREGTDEGPYIYCVAGWRGSRRGGAVA